MLEPIILQEANPENAVTLSALAMRSKAYWGYSEEFMDDCRDELTVTPEEIRSDVFYFVVAKRDDEIVGFYGVEGLSVLQFELEALFVDPLHIGTGVGRMLITHAKHYVAASGGKTLMIQSDPHAERFYRMAGAQRLGRQESASIPGRFLPMLAIDIAGSMDNASASWLKNESAR